MTFPGIRCQTSLRDWRRKDRSLWLLRITGDENVHVAIIQMSKKCTTKEHDERECQCSVNSLYVLYILYAIANKSVDIYHRRRSRGKASVMRKLSCHHHPVSSKCRCETKFQNTSPSERSSIFTTAVNNATQIFILEDLNICVTKKQTNHCHYTVGLFDYSVFLLPRCVL